MTTNKNPPMEEGELIICVGNKAFPCHREVLANSSPYFKAMFEGSYKESNADRITLKDLDPSAFEEVLNGIYKGEINITSKNACALLKLCAFLRISDFEKSCVSFIEKNLFVDNLLEVCYYADILKEKSLFNAIAEHIAEHFVEMSKIYDFSTLPVSIFEAILSQKKLDRNEDAVFLTMAKWAKKNAYKCSNMVEKLLATANLDSINFSSLVKLLSDTDDLDEVQEKESHSKTTLRITCGYNQPVMKVYLKAKAENTLLNSIISMVYTKNNSWTLVDNFETSCCNLKTIVSEKKQYFLSYDKNNSCGLFCQFWVVENGKSTKLREPPLITEDYELAVCKDFVFLYLSGDTAISTDTASTSSPTLVECLYFYNSDLCHWYSTPTMKQKVVGASLVSGGYDILYLIGGLHQNQCEKQKSPIPYQYIQSFCVTSAIWNAYCWCSKYTFYYGAACLHENNICLSGSYHNKQLTDLFMVLDLRKTPDSIATLYERKSLPRGKNNVLLSHNGKVYAIDNNPFSKMEIFRNSATTLGYSAWEMSDNEPTLPKKVTTRHHSVPMITGDITTAAVVTDYYS